jgi:hypothetical protein
VVVTLAIGGAVAGLAWSTGVRGWTYGVLAALGALALGPLLVAVLGVGVIALTTLVAVIGALFGAKGAPETITGAGLVAAGRRAVPGYFRRLAGARSPVWWGVPAGLLVGLAGMMGVQWWYVMPRESRTAVVLLGARAQIERVYEETKRFPEADQAGRLPLGNLYPEQQRREAGTLRDGFGREMAYRVEGVWRAASWTLVSAGMDGTFGTDDDLCVDGRSRLGGLLEDARTAVGRVAGLVPSAIISRADGIKAVDAVRCHERARRVGE